MARAVENEMLAAAHSARRSGIQDLLASTSLAALLRAIPPVVLAAGLLIAADGARANPQGGTVVGGSATIVQTNPKRLDIDQTSNNAIIDWRSFSIGTGELVNFNQPGAASSTLNRVTSNEASVLEGQLTANGRVFLVNPNGVLISSTAQINVGGLVATTSNIANKNFMAGKYEFDQAGKPAASIVNQGHITVRDAGLAAFVAPSVRNSGVIEARLGKVSLASGNKFTLDLYGDNLVKLAVDDSVAASLPGARVDNTGKIIADGGTVTLTAVAARGIVDNLINVGGTIEARTASMQNGKIVLGGAGGTVQVSGTLDASGRGAGETGGTIEVLGNTVGLRSGAKLDASGDAGGGTILVGGNFHGAGLEPKARTTIVESGAKIAADAVTKGDGGKVAVWSEKLTGFAGSISARGGAKGGNGGFVETSSRQDLTAVGGSVDTRAPDGHIGTWLLDPHNITIATGGGATLPLAFGTTPSSDVTIDPATLNAAASNVTLQANNDITVSNNIGLTTAGAGLTLQAGRSVLLNANITTTNGGVAIVANETAANGVVNANRDAGSANITMAAGTSISTGNAPISLTLSTGAGLTNNTSGNITLGSLTTTGAITVANNGPTAGGGISQNAGSALTAGGASSFTDASTNGAIALTNAGNALTGAVTLGTAGAGGNASLTNNAATTLAASTIGGNLTVTDTAGNLGQSGALTVGGTSTFTNTANNGTITLTNVGNALTGAVSLNTTGAGGDASLTNDAAGGTALGASTIGGNLTVSAQQADLTQSGALTVGGTSSFTVASPAFATIVLTNANNAFTGAVTLIDGSVSGDVSLTNNAATGTTLANSFVTGRNLVVVNTQGNLAQTGALVVSGTSSFTNAQANTTITLANAANSFLGAVSLSTSGAGGNASLINNHLGTVLGASTVGGNLSVTSSQGNLTQTGALSVAGSASFTASSANTTITLTNAGNQMTGTVALNTTGAGGNVSLTNNAATTLATSTIGGNLTVTDTAGNLGQSGALTVAGTSTFTNTANNGTITLNAANLLTGAVALNTTGASGDASLTNNLATTLAASTVGGGLTVIDAAGNLGQSGALTVGGASSFTTSAVNATITLNGANLLTGPVALNTNGAGGNASLNNDLATTLAPSVVGGNLAVTDTVGNLAQSGALTVAGTSTFTGTAANGTITLNAANLLSGAVALNTTGAAGNASLTNNLATTLAASAVGGNLTVTDTVGNLSQSGVLTVNGTSSFSTMAANATITLNAANALTGAVTLNTAGGGGNASLTNNAATTLAASTIGGNLTVTDTAGNLGQSGALAVGGTSSFTTTAANATITLNAPNLLTGAVALSTTGAGGNASLTDNQALTLAASTIGGNLAVTETFADLTQSGALTVAGTSSFTKTAGGFSITLTNAGNNLTGAVTLSGNSDVSLTNDAVGGTTLAASTVSGNLTVLNAGGGNIGQSGALMVGGTSSFTNTATNQSIMLTNATNNLAGAVSLNTGGANSLAQLTNARATMLGTSSVGGSLTILDSVGSMAQTGALTVNGASSFTDTAASATITLTAFNLFRGGVAVSTTGNASLSDFSGTTVLAGATVGGNLTVNVSGNLGQSGALTVGGTSSFIDNAPGGSIALNGTNSLTGAVALNTTGSGANASLTNSLATTLATSNVGGNLAINAAGDIAQSGALTVAGAASFTSTVNNATITLNGVNLLAGPVALNTTGANANASLTNGSVTSLAASTVGGNLAVTNTAGDLTVAGNISAIGHSVTLTSANGIAQSGGASITAGSVSLNAAGGSIVATVAADSVSGSAAGSALLNGSVGTLGAFTTHGAFTLADAMPAGLTIAGPLNSNGELVTITNTGPITFPGAFQLTGDMSVATTGAGNNVAFASTVDGARNLTVNAAGAAIFGGGVGQTKALASLTSAGAAHLGSGVATSGAQNYQGPVTLDANAALSGSTIGFASTIDGPHALGITGNAVFGGRVGAGTALASLSVSGTTALNGGSVATTGAQTYSGPATLGTDNTLTASTVTFGSTLNGQHALVINGSAVFDGAVGTDPQMAPASLVVNGTTTINGGHMTTLGSQTYNGPTTVNGGLIVSDTSTLDFVGPLTLTAATTLGGSSITFGGGIIGSSLATVQLGNFVGQLSFFQKEGIVTAITLSRKIDERFNRGDAAQTPAEQAFLNDPDRKNYAEDPYRKRYNILGIAAESGASFNDISYVQDGFWEGLLK